MLAGISAGARSGLGGAAWSASSAWSPQPSRSRNEPQRSQGARAASRPARIVTRDRFRQPLGNLMTTAKDDLPNTALQAVSAPGEDQPAGGSLRGVEPRQTTRLTPTQLTRARAIRARE